MTDKIRCPWCGRWRMSTVLICRNPACIGKSTDKKNLTVERPIETLTRMRKRDRMTQVERRWANEHPTHEYEPIILRTKTGHRYTPDFVDWTNMLCIEVKGPYKLGSYQRAKVVYDQIKADRPQFHFAWWTWTGTEWRQDD